MSPLLRYGSFVLLLSSATLAHAQTGIGTINPDGSAILDLSSTTKGVLFPRLDTAQRRALANPAKGLVIFNTIDNRLEANIGSTVAPIWTTVNGGIQTVRTQTAALTGANPTVTANSNTGLLILNADNPAPTGTIAISNPAVATMGQLLTVNNTTGQAATFGTPSVTVPAGGARNFMFDGTNWVALNNTATGLVNTNSSQSVSGANPTATLTPGTAYTTLTGTPTGTVSVAPPTGATAGQVITVTNNTTTPGSFTGTTPATALPVGATQQYVYNGSTWMPIGSAGPVASTSSTQTATGASPTVTVTPGTDYTNINGTPTGTVSVAPPTGAMPGQVITVTNNTTVPGLFTGTTPATAVPVGATQQYVYNGSTWMPVGSAGPVAATTSTQTASGANPTTGAPASGTNFINVIGTPTGTVGITPPANPTIGQTVTVTNNTSVPGSFTGTTPATTVPAGATQQYVYNGSTWMPVGSAGPVTTAVTPPVNQAVSGANPSTTAPAAGTGYINVTGSPTGTVTVTPPASPVAGQVVNVTNGTGVPATYAGNTIAAGGGGSYIYNGTSWVPTSGPSFYTADGTLTGARTVNQGANNLFFTSGTPGTFVRIDGANKRSLQVTNPGVSTSIFGTDGNTTVLGSDLGPIDIRAGVNQTTLAGVSRLFVGTNGNVGLGGNTNPAEVLDVTGNINTTGVLKQPNADGNKLLFLGLPTAARIAHSNWGVQYFAGNRAVNNTGAHQWYTVDGAGNEALRMTLDNVGNLNIGYKAAAAIADPTRIQMDGSHSTTPGANPKLALYSNTFGLGVSSGQLDIMSGGSHGWFTNGAKTMGLDGNGNLRAEGALTGTIFYDKDNTGYYTDPNYISRMHRIDFSHGLDVDDNNYFIDLNLTTRANAINANTINAINSMNANIYYDNNDVNYYVDPNAAATGISLNGAGEVRGNIFRDINDVNYYADPNGNSRMYRMDFSHGYDIDDNAYYIDLNQTTRTNAITTNSMSSINGISAPVFYDRDNGNYYVDPNGTSSLSHVDIKNGFTFASIGAPTVNVTTTTAAVGAAPANSWGNVHFDIGSNSPHEVYVWGGSLFPNQDGGYYLGGGGARWEAVFAKNGTIQTSDMRLKKNFAPLQYGLKEVMAIKPFTFDWKDNTNKLKKVGFSAQELQKMMPELVNVGDDTAHSLGVNYGEITPVLVKAIQEQEAKIETLEAQNAKLTAEVTHVKTLEAEMAALKTQNAALSASVAEVADLKAAMAEMRSEMNRLVLNKVADKKVAQK